MHKLRACLALCIAAALTGSAAAAPAAKGVRPTDRISGFDAPMTTVAGLEGRTWAAWAYRFAYSTALGVGLIHLPAPGSANENETDGIGDGGDPTSPLGVKGQNIPIGGPAPASTRTP
jgi:hypothetical protein